MLLIFDIGTSSMRAMLIEDRGQICKKIQKKYVLSYLPDGGVEMELISLDAALLECLEEMGDYCRKEHLRVEGISVTSQRSSVIPMGRDEKPVFRALMWQDRRCASVLERMASHEKRIFEISGMRPSPVPSAPKMRYIKEYMPEIYDKTEKLIGFQEYVLHWLTGEYVTDTSIASRTCLYDLCGNTWSEELLYLFGLDGEKLCSLTPVGSVIGECREAVQRTLGSETRILVVTAGGDQQCAALGMGCIKTSDLICNMGTGAFVAALTDRPVIDSKMRVNCNVSAIEGEWMIEGMVPSAGTTLDWLCQVFYGFMEKSKRLSILLAEAEMSPTGARGLLFRNALTGTGTPEWDPSARAAFMEIEPRHTREDFARSALEGIVRDICACVNCVETFVPRPGQVMRAAGGLSKSSFFVQMLSETLGKRVIPARDCEATGLGAWISAMHALKGRPLSGQVCEEL